MTNLELLKILHHLQIRFIRLEQAIDIKELQEKGEADMPVDPKIATLITQFDTATDKIAARIQRLIDAGGLSAESQSALQAEVARLESLGQDPENPIPASVA